MNLNRSVVGGTATKQVKTPQTSTSNGRGGRNLATASADRLPLTCGHCGKMGHRAIDCRKRKTNSEISTQKEKQVSSEKTKPANLAKVSHVKVDTGNF